MLNFRWNLHCGAGTLSLLLAVMGLPYAGAARAEAPFDFATNPGMLPKTVVPAAYRITLVTNGSLTAFTGHEDVDVDVAVATRRIVLNQAGLTISRAAIGGVVAAVALDNAAQTATLTFPQAVKAGRTTIAINYAGPITGNPYGIYHDDFATAAGVHKRMLVTQFEVADARRMFPGWDEPAFKATFQLTVTLPADELAVSNMPAASVTAAGRGMQRVVFRVTPRMSTYLVAVAAGDFGRLQAARGGTPIDLWAPKGTEPQGAYALQAATKILPYYNDYFGARYPLPKLSLIAIPNNYEAGAMENWGAITFIDDSLLFDPKTSAPDTREDIYLTVAHEMSHQWTGDLVTMGWWDNIWLNEGFATWMETKATDHFNPNWEIWPRQHAGREDAMAEDAQPTTHPIQQPIRDISAASAAFDDISYKKGEQVIRMIEQWLGPDVFRDGMRLYIARHAYGSTSSADLWNALDTVSHQNVAAVGDSFTEQPGIPLVHVARTCAGGRTTLTLTQDRFAIHDPHPAPLVWTIPVQIGVAGGVATDLLLTGRPATATFAGCGMLKVNFGENGYYRTQYDAASLALLRTGFATMGPADRANLLGDQFALFLADRAPLAYYLNLASGLRDKETDQAVWADTIDHLTTLDDLLRGNAARPAFQVFARGLLAPRLAALGWAARPGESFLDRIQRPRLITALGELNDPGVTAAAQQMFVAFQKDPQSLAPDLRDPVMKIVGLHADQATWDALRRFGEAAPGTEEKMRYFDAMAAAPGAALLAENIAFVTTGAIPNGRSLEFLSEGAQDSADPNRFLATVLPKMDPIIKMQGPLVDGYSMQAITIDASDPKLAAAILADPSVGRTSGARLDAKKAVDVMATNAALQARAGTAVSDWLRAGG